MSRENRQPVKTCRLCDTCWSDYVELVQDKMLQVNGYQATFKSPEEGLFLITHRTGDCGTTLAVRAGEMKHFYDGPAVEVRNTGNEDCPGRCLDDEDLEPCGATCDMNWIREVLQYLRRHEVPPHLTSDGRW
ncbi:hypothetical protein GF324_13115 [bacterium]|nr:hypothetical protein [bacterium]